VVIQHGVGNAGRRLAILQDPFTDGVVVRVPGRRIRPAPSHPAVDLVKPGRRRRQPRLPDVVQQPRQAEHGHVPRMLAVQPRLLRDNIVLKVKPRQQREVRHVRPMARLARRGKHRIRHRRVLRRRDRLDHHPHHRPLAILHRCCRERPPRTRRQAIAEVCKDLHPRRVQLRRHRRIQIAGEVILEPELSHAALAKALKHPLVEFHARAQQRMVR
jgi:hypothetical protein